MLMTVGYTLILEILPIRCVLWDGLISERHQALPGKYSHKDGKIVLVPGSTLYIF